MRIRRREFIGAFGASVASLSIKGLRAADGASSITYPLPPDETAALETRQAAFNIDAEGAFSSITANGRNYLASGQPAPVLTLRVAGKLYAANHATWDAAGNSLTLDFDGVGAKAVVAVRAKPTHLTLELTELRSKDEVELMLWGPYPVDIGDLVGELVGVVRDSEFAVGIQALNTKTLGGYPSQESDIEPDSPPADDTGSYPGLPDELRKQQSWRGNTAIRTPFAP